jgi:hypothetical protein
MNEHFRLATEAVPRLFEHLATSDPFTSKRIAAQSDRPGVYVLFENGISGSRWAHPESSQLLKRRHFHARKAHGAAPRARSTSPWRSPLLAPLF